MALIDLTLPWDTMEIKEKLIPLKSEKISYKAVVYDFKLNSMTGSYIDFPGHILETADGMNAGNFPLSDFYRVPATFLRPRRSGNAISANELEEAHGKSLKTPCLVIHGKAGTKIPLISRQICLSMDAVDWIINYGCKLLISDSYESENLDGVFLKLFKAGISTVCMPANLDKINSDKMKISVITPLLNDMVQVPCRIIAEIE